MSKEKLGECKICKAACYRETTEAGCKDGDPSDQWYFVESVGFVCRHHAGVEQWYKNEMAKRVKKYELAKKILNDLS